MTTSTLNRTDLGKRLALMIDLKAKAAPYRPEDNPFASKSVDDIAYGAGIMAAADLIPAVNMAAKAPGSALAFDLEAGRAAARDGAKADQSARRMAEMRRRAEKKRAFDEITESDVQPDPERMTLAWRVVFPLVPTVTRIAKGKSQWASRLLGSVTDDVAQVVLERMAVLLAKSDKDLFLLRDAADDLGRQFAHKNKAPGKQKPREAWTDDERKRAKAEAKARSWLMGMVNNRVQGTLADLYSAQHNLRTENVEIIATVMATINGVGEDPLVKRHQADKAPSFLGTRFQAPDGFDQGLLATAINAAITDRGLDRLVEILLDTDRRESTGAFRWSANAKDVFLATPGVDGQWLWDAVKRSTEHHSRKRNARGEAAMMHVRNVFDWLPGFIMDVVQSLDFHTVGRSSTNHYRAVLASDFEAYLPAASPVRTPLQPRLQYATVEEAVAALTEHIGLVTGADFVQHIQSA